MDPHTPRHGGLAHMGWIMFGEAQHNNVTVTSNARQTWQTPFTCGSASSLGP